jgi:hypothetical protein
MFIMASAVYLHNERDLKELTQNRSDYPPSFILRFSLPYPRALPLTTKEPASGQ